MANLHISISAETIFNLGPIEVTNSMLVTWIVTGLLAAFAIWISGKLKNTKKPRGLQNFVETIVESLYNLVVGVAGENTAKRIFPIIASFFIFILFANWSGLLPGFGTIGLLKNEPQQQLEETSLAQDSNEDSLAQHQEVTDSDPNLNSPEETLDSTTENPEPDLHQEAVEENHNSESAASEHTGPKFVPLFRGPTADLNTTLALALTSVILVQFFGIKALGLSYFKKFINFSSFMSFFIGILEIVSEFSKIISFAFRLFGNIFAGEVLLSVMYFLLPVLAPLPFLGLEVFVGLIQALVFAMLSLVFMNMATVSHEEAHE